MAVSKRTRYEVLRRDESTCRYCKSTDGPLTVDHVLPVALGGSDDPSNLVAACKDCNAGKSSSAPDGSLVAEVREDAIRHAEMVRQAYDVVVARMGERDDYIEQFAESYTYTPMPEDWRQSIGRFFNMGVPIELIIDAATTACAQSRNFTYDGRFKYMCGIIWNQIRVVSEAVELKQAILGAFVTESDLTDKSIEDYELGFARGSEVGSRKAREQYAMNDVHHRLLTSVVEGSYGWMRESYEECVPRILTEVRAAVPPEPEECAW